MKVLVVDDSLKDREVVRGNLERHGCQVLEAANGRQGLDLAINERPDLVISEALMPGMDGFQFLHELRKLAELPVIPFLFYASAEGGSKGAELARLLGAQAFLEKPKSPEELWDAVGKALSASSSESETTPPLREEEFLKGYLQVVSAELEEKVKALSEANDQLARLSEELEHRAGEGSGQLAAATNELEMLSYSVSHDLRAPLRHIDGFSQALADDCAANLTPMGREYLDRIQKSCRRMLDMMDALLELSRLGRSKLEIESLDLSALARQVGAEVAARNPGREVKLIVAEGAVARGDARLLKVVLDHLLSNAWKFSAQTPQPMVEFLTTEWDGQQAFAVRDNGVGFDVAYAEKLFAPFQRLHTQQEFPGVGIGLAMVKRIVSRHGGKVKAEAEAGKGATFTFTLG
ncbi:MAG TPA: ATP-binding protein [Geomonas sp.]|nr:ATP-binding protein [Geomonas sp.]